MGDFAATSLGSCCGLLLGVIHLPGSGVVRNVSIRCRRAGCVVMILLAAAWLHMMHLCRKNLDCSAHGPYGSCWREVYAGTYPWHMIPTLDPSRFPLKKQPAVENFQKRWVVLLPLLAITFVCVACILKKHPPSTYTHDAKWCTFGLWLMTLVYPVYEASRAYGYNRKRFGDCAVAFTLSLESVVLGWIVCMFQARDLAQRVDPYHRLPRQGFCRFLLSSPT